MKTKILYIFLLVILFTTNSKTAGSMEHGQDKIITDCSYTLSEALTGKEIPDEIKINLRLVDVVYYSFDNRLHAGQLVVHKDLVSDIKIIFKKLKEKKFPLQEVIPVVKYGWSDEESMQANNSSAFNYRFVAGTTRLSNHSSGSAIDLNPKLNPQIINGIASPKGAKYQSTVLGTITKDSFVVKLFKELGWEWGGDWKTRADYQHFQKIK